MKIGKYEVDSELIINYVKHLNTFSGNASDFEYRRVQLHDYIFKSLGLNRNKEEGIEFAKELDKFCYDMITDPEIRRVKRVVLGIKEEDELDKVNKLLFIGKSHELCNQMYTMRSVLEKGTQVCRVCNKDLSVVCARINDQLVDDEVDNPICLDCSRNRPDAHHLKFRENHWKNKRMEDKNESKTKKRN
jgi:hypothetical protein